VVSGPESGGEDRAEGGLTGGELLGGGRRRNNGQGFLFPVVGLLLLSVFQRGDLVTLKRDRSQRLNVAGMISFDVLGQVPFVSEPLQTGLEQTAKWLLSRVFSLVRIKFGLGEESFPAIITEQFVIARVAPHVTHEISPVAESLLALWAGVLALVGQAGCPAAAAWRERRGETALAAHVYNAGSSSVIAVACVISDQVESIV
jgi:hypothetical protein